MKFRHILVGFSTYIIGLGLILLTAAIWFNWTEVIGLGMPLFSFDSIVMLAIMGILFIIAIALIIYGIRYNKP